MSDINTLIGIVGMILLLTGFVLNLLGRLTEKSLGYILLNIFGPGILDYHAIVVESIPFLILETIWVLFAIYKLIAISIRK